MDLVTPSEAEYLLRGRRLPTKPDTVFLMPSILVIVPFGVGGLEELGVKDIFVLEFVRRTLVGCPPRLLHTATGIYTR